MNREITIYYPGRSFPSVSITGPSCSKPCDHCNGRYLKGMADVSMDGALYDFGIEHYSKGGTGFLLSGGCDIYGSVPLNDNIFRDIERLKRETELKINLHTGLVDRETAEKVGISGVDKVSFDLLGSNETIEKVLHMNRTVEDYVRSYEYLADSGVSIVPHILAGFHYGQPLGEVKAVEIAARFDPEKAVLIILIPTPGTRMEGMKSISVDDVLDIGREMRSKMEGDLVLGCMRPKGEQVLEFSLLESGFNGIVMPSRETLKRCRNEGWTLRSEYQCCAI